MFVPGADSSTSLLCVDDDAMRSEEVVFPTEITPGNPAGYCTVVPPVFPAAATRTTPAAAASSTDICTSSGRSVVSDMFTIRTPRSTSQLMQAATLESGPEPSLPNALQTQMGLLNETPATPTPLF